MSFTDRRRPALLLLTVLGAAFAVVGTTLAAPEPTGGAAEARSADARNADARFADARNADARGEAGVRAGYWLAAADGGVFAYGEAPFLGSPAGGRLNHPVVCATSTTTGSGYWLVARDGGVFAYGDAPFLGSPGDRRLNQPIVGMAATGGPGGSGGSGTGYWLLARDGGVFAYGDAPFLGSTGDRRLNQPIVGMAATPTGAGYWLVARDGGVFAYGDAPFLGSAAGRTGGHPVAGVAGTATGKGYWLAARDGGVLTFGDAPFTGSAAGQAGDDVVAIAPVARPGGCGGFVAEVPPVASGGLDETRLDEARRYAAGRAGTAGFAVVDTVTGRTASNDDGDVALRTASIVKVVIGMRLLARAAEQGRSLTAAEQADLSTMIRRSDNDAATRLWSALGSTAVIGWVRRVTGVRHTEPPARTGSWGFTTTTARDMAVILHSLVRARGVSAAQRDVLLGEMRRVTPAQRWGVDAAVHRSTPAVKNGWYPDTDAPVWRVHCTGVVDHRDHPNRFVVVVTTRYAADLGMAYGQETCAGITARALPPGI